MSSQHITNYNGSSLGSGQLATSQHPVPPYIGANNHSKGMQMFPVGTGSGVITQLPISIHPGIAESSMGVLNPMEIQSLQVQQHMHIQQHMPNVGNVVIGHALVGMGIRTPLQQHQDGIAIQKMQQYIPGGSIPIQSHSGGQPTQASTSMLAASQANPHKEINIVSLSRLGQETVQDITSRFQEIFAALKVIQPTANRENNTEKKVQEYFRTIRLLFKRVRIIYEKCNDGYPQGMEYTNFETLLPYTKESDNRMEPSQCEEYRKALQENQDLIDTVKLKNRQLREIIDRTRIIIWEINTMLSMRRS